MPVTKKSSIISFSELQINLTTHGSDYIIDSLKLSLIAKMLEASTEVHFSVILVLGMLRTLFLQKVSSSCEGELSLRKTIVQMEHNMQIRRLKPIT